MEYKMSRVIERFGRAFLVLPAWCVVVLLGGAGAAMVLGAGTAQANVEFARMTGSSCSVCHLGDRTPTSQTLNQAGNAFAACRLDDSCIRAWRVSVEKPPVPPLDRTVPAGSYQASCDTIRIVDGVLMANCRSADQSMRPTSLANPFGCPNGISNADGHLACGDTPRPRALPIGSYTHSCSNVRVVDGVLFATCTRSDQSTRESSLPRPFACEGGIDNSDGKLTCPTLATQTPGSMMWGAIAAADGRGDSGGIVDRSGTGAGATQQAAEGDALMRCGGGRNGCEIKGSFQGGCGAYASSRKHSGFGNGPSVAIAQRQAMNNCRKNSCRIALQYCVGQ
jgi:hypothetical protein